MAENIRIGVISGSLRAASHNTKLAKFVAGTLAHAGNVDIDFISLTELDLPMFSEDLEAKEFPAAAIEFKARMIACDGFLIASPEYNGSFSGALKNAIDWASRPREGEASLACFKGKAAGLLAASPGAIGGLRGLRHVRQVLTQLHTIVVPTEFALGKSHEAFDDSGSLKDENASKFASNVGSEVVRFCSTFKS